MSKGDMCTSITLLILGISALINGVNVNRLQDRVRRLEHAAPPTNQSTSEDHDCTSPGAAPSNPDPARVTNEDATY